MQTNSINLPGADSQFDMCAYARGACKHIVHVVVVYLQSFVNISLEFHSKADAEAAHGTNERIVTPKPHAAASSSS